MFSSPRVLSSIAIGFAAILFSQNLFSAATPEQLLAEVGSLPGQLSVEQGVANYSIPIGVPPGVAGLEPELALTYSSMGGDGPLGLGWSLSGFSNITRCGRTLEQDSSTIGVEWKKHDRYCLDGQRLILVAGDYGVDGSEYRTELDGSSRITAHGQAGEGPAWFQIETKAGQRIEYGGTEDSRIEANGRSEVFAWAQNRIEDAVGNALHITYEEKSAHTEFFPISVSYGPNRVEFIYQDLPVNENDLQYMSSVKFRSTVRLSSIRVLNELFSEVSSLGLSFEQRANKPDLLKSIQVCIDQQCQRPSSFTWSADESISSLYGAKNLLLFSNSFPVVTVSDDSGWTGYQAGDRYVTDINNDGLSDVFGIKTTSSWFNPEVNTPEIFISNGQQLTKLPIDTVGCSRCQFAFGDVNGDQIPDMVRANSPYLEVALGDGSGFGAFSTWAETLPAGSVTQSDGEQGYHSWSRSPVIKVVDVNGDGLGDVAAQVEDLGAWSHSTAYAQIWLSDGNQFSDSYVAPRAGGSRFGVGDVNGDGYPDIVRVNGSVYVRLGDSSGFAEREQLWGTEAAMEGFGYGGVIPRQFEVSDKNGDGLSDLNFLGSLKFRSTGAQFERRSDIPFSLQGTDLADIDGDGLADLINGFQCYKTGCALQVSFGKGPKPQVLEGITDALGNEIKIQYSNTQDTAVYTPGEELTYPYRNIRGKLPVVVAVEKDNGLNGFTKTTYRYGDAKAHVKGRGFLGFAWDEATDETTQISTRTEYRQDFPYVGMPSVVRTQTEDGVLLSETESYYTENAQTYTEQLAAGGTHDYTTHFPYLSQKIERSYELDGSLVSTVTTTQSDYDAYGNVGSVVVETSAGGETFSKTTTSVYQNNVTANKWHLGRLLESQVTHQHANGSTVTRESAFTYDPDTGLLASEIIEPNQPAYRKITTYQYDAFGNKVQATVSADSGGSRTTTTTYDPSGRFATSVSNALNHTETRTYDERFGKALTLTGPNGLTTAWEYENWGRKIAEHRADGTSTLITRSWVAEDDEHAPSLAIYKVSEQGPVILAGDGSVASAAGPAVTQYYDKLGRVIRKLSFGFDGRAIYQDTEFDDQGREHRSSLPYFAGATAYWAENHYDAVNRVYKKTFNTGEEIITTEIGFNGLTTTETNTLGQIKITRKNALGKVAEVIEEEGGRVTYEYDAIGNLLRTHQHGDAGQIVSTEISYDILGRKIAMNDPDMGQWTYTYNGFGELVSQSDAKNQTTDMQYDALGRMVLRVEPDGVTLWEFDTALNGIGKQAEVSQYNVDGNAFTTVASLPVEKLVYQQATSYDSYGRPNATLTKIEDRSFNTATDYDLFGRVEKTYRPNGFELRNLYNENGYLLAKQSPVGDIGDYDIAHLQTLKQQAIDSAAAAIQDAEAYAADASYFEQHAQAYANYLTEGGAGETYIRDESYLSALSHFLPWGQEPPPANGDYTLYRHVQNVPSAQSQLYIIRSELSQVSFLLYYYPQQVCGWGCFYGWHFFSMTEADANTQIANGTYVLADDFVRISDIDADGISDLSVMTLSTEPAPSGNFPAGHEELEARLLALSADLQAAADALALEAENALELAESLVLVAEQLQDKLRLAQYWADSSKTEDIDAMGGSDGYITWWRATARDSAGRLSAHRVGNGLVTVRDYDPATGRLNAIQSGFGYGAFVRDLEYQYDGLNNVTSRQDQVQNVQEAFIYDRLNRLTGSAVAGEFNGIAYNDTVTYSYDALGNMLDKSDLSGLPYQYGSQLRDAGGNAGPHAVRQVQRNGVWEDYQYDDNGSLVYGAGRTITWTSFNKPSHIERNGKVVSFDYGPDRARYKKSTHVDAEQTTTLYLGKAYERIENANGSVTHKHFIYTEDGLAAIHIEHEAADGSINNAADETRYMHRDALGSIDTITDGNGQVVDRMGYAPFGARRAGNWQTIAGINLALYTNRGFTGHEHLEEVGLIHMNGRVYDPEIGRFLSADPHIQFPYASQSYNRYSYVLNNPLKYTDPSGYFIPFLVALGSWIAASAVAIFNAAVAIFTAIGLPAMVAKGIVIGFGLSTGFALANGASIGQALKAGFQGAIWGGITAGIAYSIGHGAIGEGLANAVGKESFGVAKTIAHGVSQGIVSVARGGDFKSGALGGIFGHLAGGWAAKHFKGTWLGETIEGRTTVASVVGGTSAALGGGKFANGAVSAAFVHLFNNEAHAAGNLKGAPITDGQRALAEDGDYIGFWKSRYFDSADPVARTALIGWGHGDLVGASWWENASANYTWSRLESYINDNGLTVSMEQIGAKLALAHVDYVTADTINVHHLLSPTQVAGYHHQVFGGYGIPKTYFGGTRFGNSPNTYSWAWCGGCDVRP